MKILVLNCGSSSLKYQLFDMTDERVLAKGLVDRIGLGETTLTHETGDGAKTKSVIEAPSHKLAIKFVLAALTDRGGGVLTDLGELGAVGHRVVHGGERIAQPVLIDATVMDVLQECIELAPLHNPANIIGIEACRSLIPDVPQVGVFDTAFHQSMPSQAFLYAIPYEYYLKYKVRRYGFHGTSHQYVARRARQLLGPDIGTARIITCHLGNGSSVTAVRDDVSVDTSLGFGTVAGLPMGTRCGDVDPAIIPFLMDKENMTIDTINNILYKKSGLLGLSGVSSDMRDIEAAAAEGNVRAETALEVFAYNVRKFIGAYAAAMGGVDAIVFTAGIGENARNMRLRICRGLGFLGIEIDAALNECQGIEKEISRPGAKVKVYVIPTNEELMIAREAREIMGVAVTR
ncbi:MAG: acetate/propionate family kinase [bacterium]